jgi:4-hydroxybenzoyl-CoA reductase subunit beta
MMRLPPFAYRAPRKIREAVDILAGEGPEAAPVAGGTDLLPNMKRRHQTPRLLVGLRRIEGLAQKRGSARAGLRLGAGMILSDLCDDPEIGTHYPGLARAVRSISTPILRNMGTIGGNVCLDTRCNYYNQNYEWREAIGFCMKKDGVTCWVAPGSPRCWAVQSSDSVPMLVALGARVSLVGPAGEREMPIEELFRDDGIRYLNKEPHELVREIVLPPADGWRATYWKLRRRGAFDFPVLGVAGWLRMDGAAVREARIVLGGLGSAPIRAAEAERRLTSEALTEERIHEAAALAYRPAKALDNTDFYLHWRKRMARVYVERMLRELAGLPVSEGPIGH